MQTLLKIGLKRCMIYTGENGIMEKLRQQLVDLYLICFPEDTQTYAEFFVDNKWDGTNCMTLFDGDKLINMLFLVKKLI